MESIKTFIEEISWSAIITASLRMVLIFIIAWVATWLMKSALQRFEVRLVGKATARGESSLESRKRIETIVRLLKQAGLLAIWITFFLIILREIGVEVGPLIASAGIVGLAIGFGAQNLVRDVISGFFMILENQIRVGDVAVINGTGGLVEAINFRTTVLRDLAGIVHFFPNGTITTLSNMTTEWSAYVFDIGVAYKENTDEVIEVIREVADGLMADEDMKNLILEPPEIFGVDKLDNSAVIIKGRIKTLPIQQWTVGREFLRRIKLSFDEKNIEIPFPHSTIYFGEASKPFDVKLMEAAANQSKET
ncbi:MAG: mechanosensitive ion channel family protein [Pseudomonadota bacterium]|uniref:mechanosensitive ion channel family protein n=1 Tax=Methylophaga TaxID=40222 RepID=UPI001762BC96|nr:MULTISPECIES: mechanosensitive ion channel family protein [Methylophaga]MEC9411184.1 mechanosensitive ion channel family protein [Pseudomonadota bacterium]HIC45504.1 mechanosensitive ion channel family protein [Methylophaga sp.]HIM38829.1 mechanosensitive ion channel family protein [Methylophaga aminisulfidivorans]